MKKIGYILAAIYAVFSLSVTSLADDLVEDAIDGAETVASDVGDAAEDILGGDDDPAGDDTSDNEDDPAESSDTADDPEESSDTSDGNVALDTEPEITTAADTTTAPTDVGNAGSTQNPATGVVLGCTALGMAAAALTAAAARKRK